MNDYLFKLTNMSKAKSKTSKNTGESPRKAGQQSVQFKDNRPETVQQLKQQELADKFSEGKANPIQKKKNSTGIPDNLKQGVEQLSGHTMDDVKVHFNSDKPSQLNAHAYAQGTNIHIAPGQEKHLPHEAWHVAQQKQGRVKPTTQVKGAKVNDDKGLEKEADVMGAKAVSVQAKVKQLIPAKRKSFGNSVAQLQQTDVCLKSATGTYTISGTPGTQAFTFRESSKGSDVLERTQSHPKGKVDYSAKAEKYLQKIKVIPKNATGVVFTDIDTYGVKK